MNGKNFHHGAVNSAMYSTRQLNLLARNAYATYDLKDVSKRSYAFVGQTKRQSIIA
ncbi:MULTISPECIES: hypothetical protein [unclassified Mesorhizobium]|uniref:hypothetical protein n=1 Tax=unclassified Mesorhizobium TaxID=325217 RepID=UPI0015E3CFA7|nr:MULTISPECIES: hypothetical protein [unclassified Mesorhizobium]